MFWTIFSFVVLAVVALSGASVVIYTMGNSIPPSPTGRKVKRVMGKTIQDLDPKGTVCELGVGWGTLAMPIARAHPDVSLVGYENSPIPYWVARLRTAGGSNFRIERADFFGVSLREADLVVCYQSPATMSRPRPKFNAELKDTACVVSNTFAVPGWKPILTETVSDLYRTKVYVYRKSESRPVTSIT